MLFDNNQETIHPFAKLVNRQAKEEIIQKIHGGGSTAIGAALKAAIDPIILQPATHRFIIFAPDEWQNTGESPKTWRDLAKKNKIVTFAMVIGAAAAALEEHFDYAVRVAEAKDFGHKLLEVLKKAIQTILGPYSTGF